MPYRNTHMWIAVAVTCLALSLALPAQANADPVVHWGEGGVELAPERTVSGPVWMTGTEDGGAIASWVDTEGTLVAQKVTPGGEIAWGPGGAVVSTSAVSEEDVPVIRSDGMGGAYIKWDWGIPELGGTLYLQHLNSNGEVVDGWNAKGKAVASGPRLSPAMGLLADATGGVYAIYSNEDIEYVQRYDPDGSRHNGWPAGGRIVVTDCIDPSVWGEKVLTDGTLFLMVDCAKDDGWEYILAQRINPDGSYHEGWGSDGKVIYKDVWEIDRGRMIPDGDNCAFVSWVTVDGYCDGVTGLYVDEDGEPLPGWPEDGKLLIPNDEFYYYPDSGYEYVWGTMTDGADGVLLTWKQKGPEDIKASRVDRRGHFDPLWGGEAGRVFPSGPGFPFSSGGPADQAGGMFVWDDYGYLHHITNQAAVASGWPDDGLQVTTGEPLWAYTCGPLGVVFKWTDDREGTGKRAYAQKVTDPPNFDTYVLLQNPGGEDAQVEITFMLPGGFTKQETVTVLAHSRATVNVAEHFPGREVSSEVFSVKSTLPIIAERSMYFDYKGTYRGGHDCTGITAPEKTWYLAEGYTAEKFDTYLLLQNPGDDTAKVKVTYMLPESKTTTGTYTVAPHSRYTVSVDSLPGLESTELSMKITSDEPICCERAMYFDYYGRIGGHDQAAVPAPEKTWYLPEGYTGEEFDTYVLVQNPGDTPATVTYTFMRDDGENVPVTRTVGPHSRYTVKVDDIEGLSQAMFSTKVSSSVPVIAERAMYFDYRGKTGGHDSVGATSPSPTWYLAEGYTAEEFDTYILLQNTGGTTAKVKATYMLPWGETVIKTYDIDANSRYTIEVDKIGGLESTEVSTRLETTNNTEIIAERAIYFSYQGKWPGGHDTIGVNQPSDTWYFAEGYTGY